MEANIIVTYGCENEDCLLAEKCVYYLAAKQRKFKHYILPKHKVGEGCEWFLSIGI
jgi:hypothetical protein